MLGGQGAELGHQLAVPAQVQAGGDAVLDGRQAQFLQPHGLVAQ
nr:hypothetical protein [Actinomadura madurae]